MLGKLMKYEWKATWKLLLAANALTLVMTIIAWCMVKMWDQRGYSDFRMMDFMAVMVLLSYAGSMFAVSVGTAIYLIHRFYTSTYGDQGYLLHTLPIDTHHIIIAKVLVSAAWIMIDIVSIYLSVIFLLASAGDFFDSMFMMEGMKNTIGYLGAHKITIFTVVMTLIAFVFSVFADVLKVGACISLGQLSSNHKLMCSFGWYVVVYIVEQVISGVYLAIQIAFYNGLSSTHHASYFNNQWETSLIAGIISCVVYYLLTWYVMSRKLNLE